jgi:hypothetical protein
MIFFEQEVHRSLESIVAEHGIFLHFNSFYQAPVTQLPAGTPKNILTPIANGPTLTTYAQINVLHKSINSVHFVFMYTGYQNNNTQRKLHFVSHNLNKL